ncbi:MAG: hypothetical protein A2177_07660 [Spirochaetes bacterium RBG_13_68_11]|nr:MAG: hypothetical protein A2177_07660 [Spirochaetes bacterium RBG_13_68_11]
MLGDPRQEGHELVEGRASGQHHRRHAAEESLEFAHAGGREEGAEVRGEIPHPQPAEPGKRVGIDLPTKLERLNRALGGTEGGGAAPDLGDEPQHGKALDGQAFEGRRRRTGSCADHEAHRRVGGERREVAGFRRRPCEARVGFDDDERDARVGFPERLGRVP